MFNNNKWRWSVSINLEFHFGPHRPETLTKARTSSEFLGSLGSQPTPFLWGDIHHVSTVISKTPYLGAHWLRILPYTLCFNYKRTNPILLPYRWAAWLCKLDQDPRWRLSLANSAQTVGTFDSNFNARINVCWSTARPHQGPQEVSSRVLGCL